MNTLIIKDLAITSDLDQRAMSAVVGGTSQGVSCYTPCLPQLPSYCAPQPSITKNDFSFNASQMLGQEQNTMVNNGNNVAFASGISSTVTRTRPATTPSTSVDHRAGLSHCLTDLH